MRARMARRAEYELPPDLRGSENGFERSLAGRGRLVDQQQQQLGGRQSEGGQEEEGRGGAATIMHPRRTAHDPDDQIRAILAHVSLPSRPHTITNDQSHLTCFFSFVRRCLSNRRIQSLLDRPSLLRQAIDPRQRLGERKRITFPPARSRIIFRTRRTRTRTRTLRTWSEEWEWRKRQRGIRNPSLSIRRRKRRIRLSFRLLNRGVGKGKRRERGRKGRRVREMWLMRSEKRRRQITRGRKRTIMSVLSFSRPTYGPLALRRR